MAGADDMVDQAFDPKQQDVIAKAIEQLSPEEAQYFLDRLERAIRKRKIQLTGYLVAMVVWLIGMVIALFVYGSAAEGAFVGWVFVVPFGAVGLILMLFGRWAERASKAALPPAEVQALPAASRGKAKGAAAKPDAVVAKPPAAAKPAKADD